LRQFREWGSPQRLKPELRKVGIGPTESRALTKPWLTKL
jgi:hypothetical protein